MHIRNHLKKAGLISLGAALGILLGLHFSAQATREPTLPLPLEDLRTFSEVFGKIKSDYVEPVSDKKLIREAINGMVSGLDPHSTFLDEDAFRELQVSTKGEFGGLGIEVNMEDGIVRVVAPIEDTPAYRVGIMSGDQIFKIDDTLTKGLTLNKAVEKMRGQPGTQVTLSVYRKSEDKTLNFTLTRQIINVQSVKSNMIEPGYAFVRIRQFQDRTGEDLAKTLKNLYKEGELRGLVLDLRGDPGGLLNGAVGVSAAFLPKDALVVYTDGRTPEAKMRLTASKENYLRNLRDDYLKGLPSGAKNVPMVVLVDGGSASASEIVAGALQDHKRATVMGTPTFGKGSVQTILPLGNNTAIKLTTARYYTPGGRSIQAKGIEPDILVEDGREQSNRLKEADLARHLEEPEKTTRPRATTPARVGEPNSGASPTIVNIKPGETPDNKVTENQRPKFIEFGSKEDFQLAQAINHLKGLPVIAQAKASTSVQ